MPARKRSQKSLLPVNVYELTEQDRQRFATEQRLGMVPPTAPLLCKVAHQVSRDTITSEKIQSIIARLLAAARGQQQTRTTKSKKGKRMLVGLAAPQIGEAYRIVVIDVGITAERKKAGKLACFINPEVVWRTRETAEGREGCFSAGPVWGLVRRPLAVKVRAFQPDGTEIERIFEGFTARIVCHEIDHLDGIRFPERITTDRKRHWVHTEELAEYPGLIQKWPRICTLALWEAYKKGVSLYNEQYEQPTGREAQNITG